MPSGEAEAQPEQHMFQVRSRNTGDLLVVKNIVHDFDYVLQDYGVKVDRTGYGWENATSDFSVQNVVRDEHLLEVMEKSSPDENLMLGIRDDKQVMGMVFYDTSSGFEYKCTQQRKPCGKGFVRVNAKPNNGRNDITEMTSFKQGGMYVLDGEFPNPEGGVERRVILGPLMGVVVQMYFMETTAIRTDTESGNEPVPKVKELRIDGMFATTCGIVARTLTYWKLETNDDTILLAPIVGLKKAYAIDHIPLLWQRFLNALKHPGGEEFKNKFTIFEPDDISNVLKLVKARVWSWHYSVFDQDLNVHLPELTEHEEPSPPFEYFFIAFSALAPLNKDSAITPMMEDSDDIFMIPAVFESKEQWMEAFSLRTLPLEENIEDFLPKLDEMLRAEESARRKRGRGSRRVVEVVPTVEGEDEQEASEEPEKKKKTFKFPKTSVANIKSWLYRHLPSGHPEQWEEKTYKEFLKELLARKKEWKEVQSISSYNLLFQAAFTKNIHEDSEVVRMLTELKHAVKKFRPADEWNTDMPLPGEEEEEAKEGEAEAGEEAEGEDEEGWEEVEEVENDESASEDADEERAVASAGDGSPANLGRARPRARLATMQAKPLPLLLPRAGALKLPKVSDKTMASAAKGNPHALVEIVGKAMDHYSDRIVSVLGRHLSAHSGNTKVNQIVNQNTKEATQSIVETANSEIRVTSKAALEKIQKATPKESRPVNNSSVDVEGIKNAVVGALPSLENIDGIMKQLKLEDKKVKEQIADKDAELAAKNAEIAALQTALGEAQIDVKNKEVQLTRAKALNTSLFQHVLMLCVGDEAKFTQMFYGFMLLVNNKSMDKSELKNILNAALFITPDARERLQAALDRADD